MFPRIMFICILLCTLTACVTAKQSEDPDEAKRQIETAKINAQLGMAYLEQNNIQRAKKKLLIALEEASNIPEPWYSMGYFLEATGNFDEAEKHYLKAIAVSHGRGDAQNNYGTFLCRKGHYERAIERFLLAVKDPDYLDSAAAYENAGLCALKIPNYKLAHQFFDRAVLQDPKRAVSLYKLADLNCRKGNVKVAKEKLQQLTSITKATPEILLLSERIEQKLKRQKMAENLLSSAKPIFTVKTQVIPLPQEKNATTKLNASKGKQKLALYKKKKRERSTLPYVRYVS